MNPLGDENGVLIVFGVLALVVLAAAYRTRTHRYAVVLGTLAGVLCGMAIYAIAALVSLLVRGTEGYQLATWLVAVGVGLIPAGGLGLIEGFAASLIFRVLA